MHTLFTIPSAGVSAKAYQIWSGVLPKEIILRPLELPRKNEADDAFIPSSIQEVAKYLVKTIKLEEIPKSFSYSILGHSVGALIAYEMAHIIQKKGCCLPSALFVIGKNPPDVKDAVQIHEMENECFIEHLKIYGGIPEFFLNNKKYLNLFIPHIRADIKLSEKYVNANVEDLNIPITVICGQEEDLCHSIIGWKKYTTMKCTFHIISGGHFELFKNPQKIVEIIKSELQATGSLNI